VISATPDETLATWAATVTPSDLPDAVRERTRLLLLDAIASALAGVRAQERPTMAALADDLAGPGSSTVIGGRPLAPLGAAMLNGFEITGATMCDVHRSTMTHVMPEVLPAALAAVGMAEAAGRPVDGPAFLAAVAVGAETTIRVALALDGVAARDRAWHNPGVAGPFGAAVATGRLLGLDPTAMAMAFGHAGGQAGGTFAALGTSGVKLHQARGAMSGLLAATWAAHGLDASAQALTAPRGGLLSAYADGGRPEELDRGLGLAWHLDDLSLRRWPGSSSVQAVIECALAIASAAPGRAVEQAEVRLSAKSFDLAAEAGWHDQLSAMQSPRWVVAATLVDGAWGPAQIAAERLTDADVGRVARERVEVRRDPDLPMSAAIVSVRFEDGTVREERRDQPLGAPERPLTRADIIAKLQFAAETLGWASHADPLVAAVDGLPSAPSIHPLLRLLAGPER
jgi:2-methylcitrate dehydratase PrpD